MFLIYDELKKVKKKTKAVNHVSVYSLIESFIALGPWVNSIEELDKKESSVKVLKKKLREREQEISALKRQIYNAEKKEEQSIKIALSLMDQMDGVYRFALKSQNEPIICQMSLFMKVVKKEFKEIGFEEIPTVGEIFNPKWHQCLESIEWEPNTQYKIKDVIKRGYKINETVVRAALVIISK